MQKNYFVQVQSAHPYKYEQRGYIHHCNIGAEWGTPSADAMNRIVSIPAADVSFEDGQMLIERLEQGETIKDFLRSVWNQE